MNTEPISWQRRLVRLHRHQDILDQHPDWLGALTVIDQDALNCNNAGQRVTAVITTGEHAGTVRSVMWLGDSWQMADAQDGPVTAVILNDYVEVGDEVWTPSGGYFRVADVTTESDGYISGVRGEGSGWSNVWFRAKAHETTAPAPEPAEPMTPAALGDIIVVEEAFNSDAYKGQVAAVLQVTPTGRPLIMNEDSRSLYREVVRWIVVRKADSSLPEPGALVLAREFLPGARQEYKDEAEKIPAEAIGASPHRPGYLSVRYHQEIFTMESGHTTEIRHWTIVGHKDSAHAHLIQGWCAEGTPTAPAEATEVERLRQEVSSWQEKWDNLWQALGEEANNRDWCGEYDAFAERHGGPERPICWEVRVSMETTLDSDLRLDEALGRLLHPDGAGHNVDISEAIEVKHTARIEVTAPLAAMEDRVERDDLVEQALVKAGYKFDSCDVESWEQV